MHLDSHRLSYAGSAGNATQQMLSVLIAMFALVHGEAQHAMNCTAKQCGFACAKGSQTHQQQKETDIPVAAEVRWVSASQQVEGCRPLHSYPSSTCSIMV